MQREQTNTETHAVSQRRCRRPKQRAQRGERSGSGYDTMTYTDDTSFLLTGFHSLQHTNAGWWGNTGEGVQKGPVAMQQRGHSEQQLPRLLWSSSWHHHCTEVRKTCSTFLGFTPRCIVGGKKGAKWGRSGQRVEVKGQKVVRRHAGGDGCCRNRVLIKGTKYFTHSFHFLTHVS